MNHERKHHLKQNILTIQSLLSMLNRNLDLKSDPDGDEILEEAVLAAKQLHSFIDSIPSAPKGWERSGQNGQVVQQLAQNPKSEQKVVAKAFLRAAQSLELSGSEMSKIIGVSELSISRMRDGALIKEGKWMELALAFIRAYRSLDTVSGPDRGNMVAWFGSANHHLSGPPRELVLHSQGLFDVVRYLDGMRAKL